jgi:hypothetical protein
MAEVQSGKTYLGFYCAKCATPIPVAEDPSGGKVRFAGKGRLHLRCPKCSHEADYPADEARHLAAHTKH